MTKVLKRRLQNMNSTIKVLKILMSRYSIKTIMWVLSSAYYAWLYLNRLSDIVTYRGRRIENALVISISVTLNIYKEYYERKFNTLCSLHVMVGNVLLQLFLYPTLYSIDRLYVHIRFQFL